MTTGIWPLEEPLEAATLLSDDNESLIPNKILDYGTSLLSDYKINLINV